ncbi:MAG: VTT domain-containing protein [Patescibacteria group bacterium]
MFDLVSLIKTAGYLGIAGIVFAESGLFIGFFLPGDSLLFTAGFLASQDYLNILILVPISFISAVIGDSFGYGFGKKFGPRVFNREKSLIWNPEHVHRAQEFYAKHGPKTIILARFLPVIRTFAPIMAGVGQMRYRTFLAYNVIGGFLWGIGLPLLGFYLGSYIPDIDKYLIPIIALIIILSASPIIFKVLSNKDYRTSLLAAFKKFR